MPCLFPRARHLGDRPAVQVRSCRHAITLLPHQTAAATCSLAMRWTPLAWRSWPACPHMRPCRIQSQCGAKPCAGHVLGVEGSPAHMACQLPLCSSSTAPEDAGASVRETGSSDQTPGMPVNDPAQHDTNTHTHTRSAGQHRQAASIPLYLYSSVYVCSMAAAEARAKLQQGRMCGQGRGGVRACAAGAWMASESASRHARRLTPATASCR